MEKVSEGLYRLPLAGVNAYLLAGPELLLVDAGPQGSEEPILAAVAELGRSPRDLAHIVVTHCHSDHAGGAAALQRATGARIYMHADDAALVRKGQAARGTTHAAGGLINGIVYRRIISKAPIVVPPFSPDVEVDDGEVIGFGSGLRVIHAPGHCAGQVALLWNDVLFAADTCIHFAGLTIFPAYEDTDLGMGTLRRLAGEEFGAAVFAHGAPILRDAAVRFRRAFGHRPASPASQGA